MFNLWPFFYLLLGLIADTVHCLDNGLARTPPMGWMSWQRFRCQIDCQSYPEDCISEKLIQRTADRLASDGWKDVGYRYLIIDDCWQMKSRDRVTEEITADVQRFPNGIEKMGEYIHSKGLLFGIYLDYGTLTCEGYPGSMDYLELDANSLARWQVDYVKVDGCYSPQERMPGGYEDFGKYLNKTGRPIVYSCSYPAYIDWRSNTSVIDWERLQRNCNLWRILFDVQDSWSSILSIIEVYKKFGSILNPIAGPGHWNDPDMLILGNFGLSRDQQRVQMGMWCMLAAPLLISADLDSMDPFSGNLLKNPYLLAINQDSGGHEARFIGEQYGVQASLKCLWIRELEHEPQGWSIAFVYPVDGGGPIHLPITLKDMGLKNTVSFEEEDVFYTLIDVFDGSVFGKVKLDEKFIVHVNPTGIVMFRVHKEVMDYYLDFYLL
ncbi:hypothetical protein EG68_01139 [Paragonimus skrjabini miyazakii]|uniref:Alpha-galactosidase n=1 Tax=Paragonimus skrjabini miyazakii TaxID=59628 RepID=A0A8S9Z4L7_9TREM|nr:hypothetical protein EG68_01139 [Paragonimus skrjabini miyazakii]